MERELLLAAKNGDVRLLKRTLNIPNINVNCLDEEGRTPLFLAAREGKETTVQILLEAGADVNISSTKDGDTPLIIASSEGHPLSAERLIAAGAKVNGPNHKGWTPLIYAAYYGHRAVVELLLSRDAAINQTSGVTECSALYLACKANRSEMVELLIKAGADVNLPTADRNPLGVACWYGYSNVVRVLLEAGADVDTINNNGCSPLHEALENEHYEVIQLLLNVGHADPTLADSEGVPPLNLARSRRAIELIAAALQAKKLRDNLMALQETQPQLTELTHTANAGTEQMYSLGAGGAGGVGGGYNGEYSAEVAYPTESTVVTDNNNNNNTMDGDNDALMSESVTGGVENSSSKRLSARRSAQLSAKVLSTLSSLAQASPLTIECLKQFGASAAQAELEYEKIRKDPTIYEYYLFFIQSVSSAVLACQTIASGFVDDSRLSTAEMVMQGIDTAAQAVSWMGAPLVTGIGKLLVSLPNQFERQRTIRRITTYFPSVDSHKYIEILARELTILLCKEIHSVLRETKKKPKHSILQRVMRVVEWMQTASNLSVVQGYACGQASRLIDALMTSETPFVVDFTHIPLLMEWTTGLNSEDIESRRGDRPNTPLSSDKTRPLTAGAGSSDVSAADFSEKTSTSVFAEKEVVDERIEQLERRLSLERHQRAEVEQQHLKDIKALKKQMKGLEAVNQIFSGAASGGLVNAQSAEEVHKTIGDHLTHQTQQQLEQAGAIRELAMRLDLLAEDNNLRTPERVCVAGAPAGSSAYSSDKGAPRMGDWVNNKTSYTADVLPLPSPSSSQASSSSYSTPLKSSVGKSSHRRGGAAQRPHHQTSADTGIDSEGSQNWEDPTTIGAGGCCSIS